MVVKPAARRRVRRVETCIVSGGLVGDGVELRIEGLKGGLGFWLRLGEEEGGD